MKLGRLLSNGKPTIAVCDADGKWRELPQRGAINRSMKAAIHRWDSMLMDELIAQSTELDETKIELLCPIPSPEKVICVGKNYADHAQEMGSDPPDIPVIFNKLSSCLIGNNETIVLPAISEKVDYEAELVVVVGKGGRHIPREQALEHVFGYTIGNDVSARDWQKGRPGGQWLLGKTFDTFGPVGPYIVSADEISDPHDLDITLRLNSKQMQAGNTSQLVFPIDFLIAHLSKFFTLKPGDLIFTGTPAGVGAGRTPEVYLRSGDVVEITIDQIGNLTTPVADSVS